MRYYVYTHYMANENHIVIRTNYDKMLFSHKLFNGKKKIVTYICNEIVALEHPNSWRKFKSEDIIKLLMNFNKYEIKEEYKYNTYSFIQKLLIEAADEIHI
jgi:hypothetical protein